MDKTIHIIAGPTASGKSAAAITMARTINGAVINCDSRQIYNDLPILSAQPSEDDKQQCPHYLYGTLHPNEVCSAGVWLDMVKPIINDCLAKGIAPIITGGNGLYIKTLIEGMSPIPDVPDDIRKQAVQKQRDLGNPAFYHMLQNLDTLTTAQYHPNHTARLVHAYEVLLATGTPLAQWQAMPKRPPPDDWMFDITLVMPPRDVLYERCNKRFVQMLDMGAVDELKAFDKRLASGEFSPESTLVKTIGALALRSWQAGEISKDEAITLGQTETRQYAKRQMTWFNNQVKKADNIIGIHHVNS